MHMRTILLLTLLVCVSAQRGGAGGARGQAAGTEGLQTYRDNKLADMFAATNKLIKQAAERISPAERKGMVDKAYMMAAAGSDRSVNLGAQGALENLAAGNRRRLAGEYNPAEGNLAGALEAQRAILKATLSGKARAAESATRVGSAAAYAMMDPGGQFTVDHMLPQDGGGLRRLARKLLA